MLWGWVKRRSLTIGLIVVFAGWYLVQLAVISMLGSDVAVWWFYFTSDLSSGYILAAISHNMAETGHLRRNITMLLIAGGLTEPYLERKRYVMLLLLTSLLSIVFANLLSTIFGTIWVLAGPSGGILGLWAYVGVRNYSMIFDSSGWQDSVEAVLIISGILTVVFVPLLDTCLTGAVNVSHAVGIVIGYGIALAEAPSPVRRFR